MVVAISDSNDKRQEEVPKVSVFDEPVVDENTAKDCADTRADVADAQVAAEVQAPAMDSQSGVDNEAEKR